MNASNELRRTIRVLRKMWPSSEARQLDHFEQSIEFAEERWKEISAAAVEVPALAVNFAQEKPQSEGGK